MILTISPNTSTDRVYVVSGFRPGATMRSHLSFDQAGGSGAHVSGVVGQLGGESRALVVLGGGNGLRWRAAAARQGIDYRAVEIDVENRSSVVVVDRQLGLVAEIVDGGPRLGGGEHEALLELLRRELPAASLLVLSGSLPAGMPQDLYFSAIEVARRHGVKVIIDAHSEPMEAALGARPWMVKVNLEEFGGLMGGYPRDMAERVGAAQEFAARHGIEVLLLSMAQEGAVLAYGGHAWHLPVPPVPSHLPGSEGINPVGCGDAMVGAFAWAYERTGDVLEAARWGVAAAHVNLAKYEVPSCPLPEVEAVLSFVETRMMAQEEKV